MQEQKQGLPDKTLRQILKLSKVFITLYSSEYDLIKQNYFDLDFWLAYLKFHLIFCLEVFRLSGCTVNKLQQSQQKKINNISDTDLISRVDYILLIMPLTVSKVRQLVHLPCQIMSAEQLFWPVLGLKCEIFKLGNGRVDTNFMSKYMTVTCNQKSGGAGQRLVLHYSFTILLSLHSFPVSLLQHGNHSCCFSTTWNVFVFTNYPHDHFPHLNIMLH